MIATICFSFGEIQRKKEWPLQKNRTEKGPAEHVMKVQALAFDDRHAMM